MKTFEFVWFCLALPFFNLLFLPYPAVVNAFNPNPKKIESSTDTGEFRDGRCVAFGFWLSFMCSQQKPICTFNILSPKDEIYKEVGRVLLLFSEKQLVKIKSRVHGKQKLFLPSTGGVHKEW